MNPTSLIGHVLELSELIEQNTLPADRIANKFFRERKYVGSHDRRFISEAIFGMLRHRRYITTLLEHFIAAHPSATELNTSSQRLLSLFIIYATLFDHSTPVPQSFQSYWKTFFPTIDFILFTQWILEHKSLDSIVTDEATRLGVKYSFQDWMVREWRGQIGEDIEVLLQTFNTPAPTTLRVNLLKTTREECQKRFFAEGIETSSTRFSSAGLIAHKRFNLQSSQVFKDGLFEVQDEGSQIVSLVAMPHPGDVVIDACAGAGGKSLHMAELMKNEGEIIAIDVEQKRLDELRVRAKRAGVQCVKVFHRDNILAENLLSKADLVLVDAPCSGVGTIRRNLGLKWSVTKSLVSHYCERQRDLLELNSSFVKVGGRLVYATCSLFQQENEYVIQAFLAAHSDFVLWRPTEVVKNLGLELEGDSVKLFPHRHGTDGFFVAIMKRIH
ncbi:MAG: RsmB/NOP family class I SAM-dependent RNA methyltransferase [Ignavibacteriae bacterium]|nr:RsmB/NOP family class I SAM-dependent RNA methyltransferase [Ignavibacteriota bacterium]